MDEFTPSHPSLMSANAMRTILDRSLSRYHRHLVVQRLLLEEQRRLVRERQREGCLSFQEWVEPYLRADREVRELLLRLSQR
jgi:hypothetical protein